VDGAAAAPAPKRPNVQMPDEYLPPNKILFLQNLPESVTKDQLMALFSQYVSSACITLIIFADSPYHRYPNLYEVRLIPTKKDIAFVEYTDEGSAGVAKDALHNYKLDGENKIKVCPSRPNMIYLFTTITCRSLSQGNNGCRLSRAGPVCGDVYFVGNNIVLVSFPTSEVRSLNLHAGG
jgi:RNA recognition motif-containing protein